MSELPNRDAAAEDDLVARCRAIRDAIPARGLFHEKKWRIAPGPLAVDAATLLELERLGKVLHAFARACNKLYHLSVEGRQPEWIARWLDAGKPRKLVEFARQKKLRSALPAVIRPDLIVTESGFALCEIDSVPGGIGATAWMQQAYAAYGAAPLAGGSRGMLEGFRAVMPEGGDIVISEEAADYIPEMEWLAAMNPAVRVAAARDYRLGDRPVYRFFEAFDLPNLPMAEQWMEAVGEGAAMTPPLKPYLEEKLWLGLFWLAPLRGYWRAELGEGYDSKLRGIIPYTWVLSPDPLPPHAVLPRLDAHGWLDLAGRSQKERRLVVKVSGFSPMAWGSRGVWFGHDMPAQEWGRVLEDGLREFGTAPRIVQTFEAAAKREVAYCDFETGQMATMSARIRLCPYYFVVGEEVRLGGVLATGVPADKKAIHGMSEAVLAPV